jgi:SAM-dependent methyltransferase
MHPEEYRRLAALEATHWWYRSLHDLVLGLLDEQAPRLPARPRILDAGCGTGLMAAKLAARGDVAAMDLSPIAAEYWPGRGDGEGSGVTADRRPPVSPPAVGGRRGGRSEAMLGAAHSAVGGPPVFLRGSVSALPFRDASFDVVVSLDVLYHRAVADDLAAARELGRMLRPGGILLLNLPAYDSLRSAHDRVIHTARRYTRARVAKLLAAAGLEPLRVRHWNTFLFPLAAAVRLWGRLRATVAGRTPPEESDLHPVSPWLNEALRRVVGWELALRDRWDPPYGLSIVAVGRKPEGGRARPGSPRPGTGEASCAS